jgi:predicted nucleic acid-binding protein
MLVVCDTSPVSSLLQIDRGEILRDLFNIVCIPEAVHAELARFHSTLPAFLDVRTVMDQARVQSFLPQLDLGEAEAIVLAIETKADHLLVDERRGRTIAAHAGVPVMGLVGVLLLAKQRGRIVSLKTCLEELRIKAGFYLSDSLIRRALQAAGEP